jgi:1-acyl-sn-glycerol-3-phosphate acyltransferase
MIHYINQSLSFIFICLLSSFFYLLHIIPFFMYKFEYYINNCIQNWYSSIFFILHYFFNVNIYVSYHFFDLINDKDDYLIISNHISEIDYIFILCLQSFKDNICKLTIVLKNSLRYIFFSLGWACWLNDFIFVKRNYAKDKKYILEKMKKLKDKNILIFPEGTIYCDSTYLKNKNYCEKNNIKCLDYLLNPKFKGIELIKQYTKNKIYDMTIIYDKMPYLNRTVSQYTIANILKYDLLPKNVYIHINKFDNIEITDEKLKDIFIEKDKHIKNFNENKKIKYIKLVPNNKDIINGIFTLFNSILGIYLLLNTNFYLYYVLSYFFIINVLIILDDK